MPQLTTTRTPAVSSNIPTLRVALLSTEHYPSNPHATVGLPLRGLATPEPWNCVSQDSGLNYSALSLWAQESGTEHQGGAGGASKEVARL